MQIFFELMLVLAFTSSCLVFMLFCFGYYFVFSTHPVFYRSFLPYSTQNFHWIHWIIFPFIHLYTYYVIFVISCTVYFPLFMFALYGIYFVPFVLSELCIGKRSTKYKSLHFLRNNVTTLQFEYRFYRFYHRSVFLLQEKVLEPIELFLVPTQAFTIDFVLYCVYMLSTCGTSQGYFGELFLVSFAWFAISAWSFVLWLGGCLHFRSLRILNSWKYRGNWKLKVERKMMNKFRKSCLPIRIHYGKAYTIRKITVIKFWNGLMKGVFRTMLTFKRSL